MDFRAKLISGLEEKKLQDERDRESGVKSNNRPTNNNNNNKNNRNSNQNTTNTTSTSSTTSSNNNPNANNNRNNNQNHQNNNNNKGNNNNNRNKNQNQNNFGNRKTEKVFYEGFTRVGFLSDKKHYQVLRSLALYCGPSSFGNLSCTCRFLENFARNHAPRHFYRTFPLGYEQVNVNVLLNILERQGPESVLTPTTVSASNSGKQNAIMNYWKDSLRAGENDENTFNRSLVPEFVGGVAVGTFVSGAEESGERSYIIKYTDLHSIQSFVDLAVRLVNASGDELKQSIPYGNGTATFSRYGFGGEKVIITIKDGSSTTHAVNFDQFCLRTFIAASAYLELVKRFIEKQQPRADANNNLEVAEKQQEKLSLLNSRFKVESLQNSVSSLKRQLKGSVGSNYFKGQERKGNFEAKRKQPLSTSSLVMELLQDDQNQVKIAQEQARKMTEDVKASKAAAAEEKAKLRQLQKEAFERERESRTQILRKRIPGQAEQPRPLFVLPPPDTPEQIKEKQRELKAMKAKELEEQKIAAEFKAKKAEEKKLRNEQKKLNREKEKALKSQQPKQQQPQKPVAQPEPVKEEPKVVKQPQPPRQKTPLEIAAEKRALILEQQAEAHRLKKKQVQLTKLAQLEVKKAAQAEGQQNKPVKQKKETPAPKGKKQSALATKEPSNNTTIILMGSVLLFAIIAYFLLYGQA